MKNFVSKNKLGAGLKLAQWLVPLFLLVITGCASRETVESYYPNFYNLTPGGIASFQNRRNSATSFRPDPIRAGNFAGG